MIHTTTGPQAFTVILLLESLDIKLAGFITHAAQAYPQQSLDEMSLPFEKVCKDKGLEYKGCFNCQGYLADFMHEAV